MKSLAYLVAMAGFVQGGKMLFKAHVLELWLTRAMWQYLHKGPTVVDVLINANYYLCLFKLELQHLNQMTQKNFID